MILHASNSAKRVGWRIVEAALATQRSRSYSTRQRRQSVRRQTSLGKGEVYYFESAVTLAYARRNNPTVQQWIIGPASKQRDEMPVQLIAGSEKVILRGMVGSQGLTAILTNWGETQKVTVRFQEFIRQLMR